MLTVGVVYLPSGFLGGLYAGKYNKKSRKKILAIPGIIGVVGFILIAYIGDFLPLSDINIVRELLMPLSGTIIGSYLGGYTIIPKVEKKE